MSKEEQRLDSGANNHKKRPPPARPTPTPTSPPTPNTTPNQHANNSDKIATECLKATGWSVESAIEHFYTSGLSSTVSAADQRAIEKLFDVYKGEKEGGSSCCCCW